MEDKIITDRLNTIRENLLKAKLRTRSKVTKLYILKAMLELDQLCTNFLSTEKEIIS